MAEEPILRIVPNGAALDLLRTILDQPDHPEYGEPVWETEVGLTITKSDLQAFMYEQRDLVQVGVFMGEDGTAEAIALPDQSARISPFLHDE